MGPVFRKSFKVKLVQNNNNNNQQIIRVDVIYLLLLSIIMYYDKTNFGNLVQVDWNEMCQMLEHDDTRKMRRRGHNK